MIPSDMFTKGDLEKINKSLAEMAAKTREFYEFHGLTPEDIAVATGDFKSFMESDAKRVCVKTFWHSPLGKKAFILGWHYGRKR